MNILAAALLASTPTVESEASDPNDWQWDRETPICALRQQISPSGERLEVRRTPGNDETEILITFRAGTKVREGHFRDALITADPGGKVLSDVRSGTDKTGEPQIHIATPDPNFIERFSSAAALEISHERIGSVRLGVRSPSLAVAALRNCEDRKMAIWGIQASAWRALRSRPFPLKPVRDRFSGLDYPVEAAERHMEADAIIRLDVGPDGAVTRCAGLNSGPYRGFEEASCRVLKGARFRPAVNSTGTPTSAPFVFDVRFRLAE